MRIAHEPLEKVTVFVTRGPTEARELLVFRHPMGGVQLPAGTIEQNEPAEEAALRETWEETGLTAVTVAAYFGVQPQVMRADYHMVLRRVTLLQQPRADAPDVVQPFSTYLGLRRGLPVRQVGEAQNGYVKVAYEEFDAAAIANDEFDIPSRSVSGWVESDSITPVLLRHFFHLTTTEPTPDSWVQSAEEWEHRFELYWAPLRFPMTTVTGLIPSQAVWLTEHAERLL